MSYKQKFLKLLALYNIRNCHLQRDIDLTCRLGDCRKFYECKIIKQKLYKLIRQIEDELGQTPRGHRLLQKAKILAQKQEIDRPVSDGIYAEYKTHRPRNFQFHFYPKSYYERQQFNNKKSPDSFTLTMDSWQEKDHGDWGFSTRPSWYYKHAPNVDMNRYRPSDQFLHQSDINKPLLNMELSSSDLSNWSAQNKLRNQQIDSLLYDPNYPYMNPFNGPVNQHYHQELNLDDTRYNLRDHNFVENEPLNCD